MPKNEISKLKLPQNFSKKYFLFFPKPSDFKPCQAVFMKEVTVMNKMTISVSRKPNKKAALNAKELTIREKFFRMLFGPQRKVMVLVPGDQMDLITIQRKGD